MGSLRSLLSEARRKPRPPTKDEVVAHIYQKRKNREEYPQGRYDKAGRWYPSDEGKCACCYGIRSPSRSWPYSLRDHCRTKKHVRSLVEKVWDDSEERRRLIEKVKAAPIRILTAIKRVIRGIFLLAWERVRSIIKGARREGRDGMSETGGLGVPHESDNPKRKIVQSLKNLFL